MKTLASTASLRRRSTVLALAACVVGIAGLPATASAQAAYPNKVVTIVVPFAAGGTTDILARLVGQALGTELGQQVVDFAPISRRFRGWPTCPTCWSPTRSNRSRRCPS